MSRLYKIVNRQLLQFVQQQTHTLLHCVGFWDEQVVDLNFVCTEIQESEVGEGFPTVLHQEDTIDVRVVKLSQFGEVVRKTYLKQTMSEP